MIDLLVGMLSQAIQVISVMLLVLVGASILVGALSTPVSHVITDDWERRNLRGGR